MTFELIDPEGQTIDEETVDIEGNEAEETETLTSGGGPNRRSEYTIEVTAIDEQNNEDSDQELVAGSG